MVVQSNGEYFLGIDRDPWYLKKSFKLHNIVCESLTRGTFVAHEFLLNVPPFASLF